MLEEALIPLDFFALSALALEPRAVGPHEVTLPFDIARHQHHLALLARTNQEHSIVASGRVSVVHV